jgi:hypothetical protein
VDEDVSFALALLGLLVLPFLLKIILWGQVRCRINERPETGHDRAARREDSWYGHLMDRPVPSWVDEADEELFAERSARRQ